MLSSPVNKLNITICLSSIVQSPIKYVIVNIRYRSVFVFLETKKKNTEKLRLTWKFDNMFASLPVKSSLWIHPAIQHVGKVNLLNEHKSMFLQRSSSRPWSSLMNHNKRKIWKFQSCTFKHPTSISSKKQWYLYKELFKESR